MTISIPRGDYRAFKFKIKNKDETECNINFKEIYITFKRSCYIRDILFQKRLSKKEITETEDGYYHFEILPEDTEKLEYGTYFFDIEICNDEPKVKQTTLGKLELTKEITHVENEV